MQELAIVIDFRPARWKPVDESRTSPPNATAPHRCWNWLVADWQWPSASLFAAFGLAALAPVWFATAGLVLGCVYLQLPIYPLHQWEEHRGDRFQLYIDRVIGRGREDLTPAATFWINALGVWLLDVVALYLAVFVDPSLGLMAIYLPLLNSLGHVVPAVVRGEYNPGLWTTLGLFLPVSGACAVIVATQSHACWKAHSLGAAVAFGVHAAIVVVVKRSLSRLAAATSQQS